MILLLGDYSSVHYELSKALKTKGERVILMSDGDAYKRIKCDVQLPVLKKSKFLLMNRALLFLRFFGCFGLKNYFKVKKEIEKIENIDVIQIINPVVVASLGALGNILLIRYLKKRTRVLSLCALGDDYHWVSACLNKKFKYSAMDRYDPRSFKSIVYYSYMLKYIYSPLYRFLDYYACKSADMIIPGLMDYKIAYESHEKVTEIIGLPIASESFQKPQPTKYPIKIFHAWQVGKESRKGNDILDCIVKKYISEYGTNKICYEVVSNLTYDQYLKKYKEADIIFDQIYSYDRGVTGALGMAAGKVVFSGFEEEHMVVGVNAVPDKDDLYRCFLEILESICLVDELKLNAYVYAEKHYNSNVVASKYLEVWRDNKIDELSS